MDLSARVEGAGPGVSANADRLAFFDSLAESWDDEVATPTFIDRLRHAVAGFEIGGGESVVDLGCGTGNLTILLAGLLSGEARIIGVDLSPRMLERARSKLSGDRRVEWIEADASALPIPDQMIDRVISLSTWPHFSEPGRVATEIYRVLSPGGRFHLLHLDGRETINELHEGIGGAVAGDRLPPAEEVGAFLEETGFVVGELIDEPDRYLVSAQRPPG